MRVLLLPMVYSTTKLFGISMVNFLVDMVRVVNAVRRDIEWTFAVPETKQFISWDDKVFDSLDRTSPLPILQDGCMAAGGIDDGWALVDTPCLSPGIFKFASSKDYLKYDVVVSCYYVWQTVLSMQAQPSPKSFHRMAYFYEPPGLLNLLTETHLDTGLCTKLGNTAAKASMMASMLASAVTVVLTGLDRGVVKQLQREYLSPSAQRDLDMKLLLPPLDLRRIPKIKRPVDRAVFFHGGTWVAKRNIVKMTDALGKVYAIDESIRLLLTTQDNVSKYGDSMARLPWIEVVENCDREMYLDVMHKADFSLCCADYEGTGLAYMEAVASGMTPIWIKRPWNVDRLPKGYRFLCEGYTDFARAVHFAHHNPKEAKETGKEAVEFVRKNYKVSEVGMSWSEVIDATLMSRLKANAIRNGGHYLSKLTCRSLAAIACTTFSFLDILAGIASHSEKLSVDDLRPKEAALRVAAMTAGAFELEPGVWSYDPSRNLYP